jgi:hypothetical protein
MSNAAITSSKVNLVTDNNPKYLVATSEEKKKVEYWISSLLIDNLLCQNCQFYKWWFQFAQTSRKHFLLLLHDFVLRSTEYLPTVLHDLLYMSDYLEYVIEIQNLNFVEMAEKSNDARSDARQL